MADHSKDKTILSDSREHRTNRMIERELEDHTFLPVIIKRTDESVRHPDDTLERIIVEGTEQLNRRAISLGLSALAAGLVLGFSAMAVALAAALVPPEFGRIGQRLAMASVYPWGFVICVMSGSQLFTEHTATAVYPYLDNKVSAGKLLRLWIIVIGGNLLGTLLSSILLTIAEPVIGAKDGYLEIARHAIEIQPPILVVSAVLAGWLMAQGSWLVHMTPPASSQIICIYLVTFLIGLGGLHHSIAGSAEMFVAFILEENIGIFEVLRFIALTLMGNLIGGSIFVAILNYAHVRRTQVSS